MRLSESQIKHGIMHSEQFVRDAAVRYFADSFSDDPTVMPLVIQAIETYRWDDAFGFSRNFADLAQTGDTLLWLIGELEKTSSPPEPEPETDGFRNLPAPEPRTPIIRQQRVGRNDACPCGSGRRYKRCCMGKDS